MSGVTSVLPSIKGRVATVEVTSKLTWSQSVVGRPGPEAKSHFVLISQQSLPSETLLDNLEEFMTYGIF